jgi:hemolysin activation/secretion protein
MPKLTNDGISICLLVFFLIVANMICQPLQAQTIEDRNTTASKIPEKIVVERFEIVGSSVFSNEELAKVTKPYEHRPLTPSELFQARTAITKFYTDRGYVNSGAYIPPQELNNGTVKIAVIEGKLEAINITGTKHLNPKYISQRIQKAAGTPVKVESLLEALQLLRLDPLIANVSAELSAGINPGTSRLDIKIEEADVFNINTNLNNTRSPSVGSNQRSIGLSHGNLLGFGDKFDFNYTNTQGSDSFDVAYAVPYNAQNGTISLNYGTNSNDVIEEPFNPLDIQTKSRYYELSLRQPLIIKPNRELAIGLSFSRQTSETSLLDTPFALSRGADEDGNTRISAIRLFQELVDRNERQVFAARSQLSIGLDLFNATSNDCVPDSTFVAWQGQSQWVRRLDRDFLFLLQGNIQLATTPLVPLEQFRLGGIGSSRGYRQDLILGDNGIFALAELRVPVLRIDRLDGVLQIAPFFDIGTVWNNDDVEIQTKTLPSVGLGLNFTAGERFNARLDWGIPLVDVDTESNSLQEDGIYFSIDYKLF